MLLPGEDFFFTPLHLTRHVRLYDLLQGRYTYPLLIPLLSPVAFYASLKLCIIKEGGRGTRLLRSYINAQKRSRLVAQKLIGSNM